MDSDNDDEMPDHHHSGVDDAMFALRGSGCSNDLENSEDPDFDLVPIRSGNAFLDLNTMATLRSRFQQSPFRESSVVHDDGKTTDEESVGRPNRDPPKWVFSSACDKKSNNTHVQVSTPCRIHESTQISLSAGCTKHKRRWSFSPIARNLDDSLLKTGNCGNTSKIPDLGTLGTFQLTPAILERQRLETESFGSTCMCTLSQSMEEIHEKPTRHEFDAPRNGQLGLVIESDDFTGLVVYSVKDYSPLLGLVQKGDKIVQVDGKNTSLCNLTDMSRLLSTKPGILQGSHANLKIIVLRPPSNDRTNS